VNKPSKEIASVAELLAHAYRIEVDAEERYQLLADQMETHNNPELAQLFRKFAGHEAHHAEEIKEQMQGMGIPELKPWDHKWQSDESPEAVDITRLRYNMTPWHALQLALKAERNAFDFFDRIARAAPDPELRKWAEEFRAEEAEHVEFVLKELTKHPEPPAGWDVDPDPVSHQE
jgi:rubrerythrin